MEITAATRSLAALAQDSRLSTFRLLVRAGGEGMPAGAIAQALDIPHNTLSTHLATLTNAGLIRPRREGRSIIYSVNFDGTRALLGFLLEDCCQGAPEVCTPVLDSVLADCCSPLPEGETTHETPAR
ncbi:ArsR/SmtB family transcription factor [Lentisalinibacter sediminis]|uniref:ArsR/SmtB family transcription factor n=1 Tax=Lentisalinibacter sediminis TaxID=2992237 RepID=UPI00386E0E80